LKAAITDAVQLYKSEAGRRDLAFNLNLAECPERVVGDCKKIQTVVANLTGNARMLR
jgi:signal transduction histidine kinase